LIRDRQSRFVPGGRTFVPCIGDRRSRATRARAASLALILGTVVSASAVGADDPGHLGVAIPSDAVLYVRVSASEARRSLLEPLREALEDAGLLELASDVEAVVATRLPAAEREELESLSASLREVLGVASWRRLAAREVCVAGRLADLGPELVVLFRVDVHETSELHDELEETLRSIERLAPGFLDVETTELAGARVSRLALPGTPWGVLVASRVDVIALASSESWLEDDEKVKVFRRYQLKIGM